MSEVLKSSVQRVRDASWVLGPLALVALALLSFAALAALGVVR